MAWRERTGLIVLVLAALVLASVPATIGGMAEPTGLDEAPPRAGFAPDLAAFQKAMAWSTANKASLLSPLLPGAALYGMMDETLAAYEDGQAWATHRLAVEDRASLEAGLAALLAPYGVAPLEDGMALLPDAWVAPLATLVRAQLQHQAPALSPAPPGAGTLPPGPSLPAIEENLAQGAWLLGVVELVTPVLDATKDALGEEPILVDPVGLVIIGGTGDNVYEKPGLPVHWDGPILLVEPGGDDVYEMDVASNSVLRSANPLTMSNVALNLELEGDDTYLGRVGRVTTLGPSVGISLDVRGNDSYATAKLAEGVASSIHSFAYVGDREGDDVYRVKEFGLAYAGLPLPGVGLPATAVLADWQGNDQYLANTEHQGAESTHAAATDFGALAILRDYAGNDTYVSNIIAQATAEDGGIALLIDDEGEDHHHADNPGGTTYGMRYFSDGGLDGPGNRGLAYYLDGGGTDTFAQAPGVPTPGRAGDGVQRVFTGEFRAWSVFIDCQTPEDADFPCEQHQEWVARDILNSMPILPRDWLPD